MRIVVAAGFEAGSHWAHAINSVKMAEGFARLGHEVTIACRRGPNGKASPTELEIEYGLRETIRWIQLPGRLWGLNGGEHWGFGLPAALVIRGKNPELVYARNYIVPWLSSKLGFATAAESHAHVGNKTPQLLRLVSASKQPAFRCWITISTVLAEYYRSLGVPEDKLLVLPDAVDVQLFERPDDLPPSPYASDGPNLVYAGHLYDYKGIPTILGAAARLPDAQFHFIGGWPEDIDRQRTRATELGLKNVTFHRMKVHSEVPRYLWHGDVLLLPPSAAHPSAAWTSPLKLGEYLAAAVPVVATDIPALHEWVTDREVEFVRADDADSLVAGVKNVLNDGTRRQQRIESGLSRARILSYENRARSILEFAGFL